MNEIKNLIKQCAIRKKTYNKINIVITKNDDDGKKQPRSTSERTRE